MDPILIVLIVLAVLVVLLFIGGYIANGRRRQAEEATLRARVEQADQHLARAHAEDKGWERGALEAAARAAYRERHGREPEQLHERLVLGRSGGSWVPRS
jgi:hypothetical protein